MRAASWGADMLDLFLPSGCVACRSWIPGGRGAPLVCARCRSRLREAPWPRCSRCQHPLATGRSVATGCPECAEWPTELTAARSAFLLEPPADDLVHALKYEGWPELADFMGAALMPVVAPAADGPRPLVPVPTTPERMRSRGYNQAELMARRLGDALDLPVCDALRRRGTRRSQTGLAPVERRENVRGVFSAVPAAASRVGGANVLLVDDVLTTGATASEAALVLGDMGAESVTLITFARAVAEAWQKGPRNGLRR